MKKSLLQSRFQRPCFWHLTFTSWICLRTFQFPFISNRRQGHPCQMTCFWCHCTSKNILPWWHSKNQSNQSSLHTLFNCANRSPQLVNRKLCLLQKRILLFLQSVTLISALWRKHICSLTIEMRHNKFNRCSGMTYAWHLLLKAWTEFCNS